MRRELFDDAIGEVPPSTVDVDAVIARGRRAARLRRVANPVVAAGVAVVLLTGAVAYTMTRDDGVPVGGPPVSPTQAPTVPTTTETKGALPPDATPPAACSRPDLESGAQVAARVSPVTKAAVQAQRPDLQLLDNPVATYPEDVPHAAFEFYHVTRETPVDLPICDKESAVQGWATTRGPEGDGNVFIFMTPAYFPTPGSCADYNPDQCVETKGPHGEPVVETWETDENGVTNNQMSVVRLDGTLVRVAVENIGTSIKTGGQPTATSLPLTFEQMIAIGTAQGITLFPQA